MNYIKEHELYKTGRQKLSSQTFHLADVAIY